MRKFVPYLISGILFYGGISFAKESQTVIEEPESKNYYELSLTPQEHDKRYGKDKPEEIKEGESKDEYIGRTFKPFNAYREKYGKNEDDTIFKEYLPPRNTSKLNEIREGGESDLDYDIRNHYDPFRFFRKKIGETPSFYEYEPTENLVRNSGGRGLIYGSRRYIPMIDISDDPDFSPKARYFKIPSNVDIKHFPIGDVGINRLEEYGFKEYDQNGEPIVSPIEDDSYLK